MGTQNRNPTSHVSVASKAVAGNCDQDRDHGKNSQFGRSRARVFLIPVIVALGLVVALLPGTPTADAASYSKPDVSCASKRTYIDIVKPRKCRLLVMTTRSLGWGRNGRRMERGRWKRWTHKKAVGTVYLRKVRSNLGRKRINGRRYGKVRIKFDQPRRYEEQIPGEYGTFPTNKWYFNRTQFRFKGRWMTYQHDGGCDSFSGSKC